jgi:hypothetical protein
MSIYVTSLDFCGEFEGDDPAPLIYQRSHVMPAAYHRRGGSLDLGEIPGFITVDGKCLAGKECTRPDVSEDCCEYADEPTRWPFLRVSVRPSTRPSMAEYGELQEMVERLRRDHAGCADDCVALLRADLLDRVSDPEDTVVLDRSQVEKLRDHLTEWLGRTSG